MVLLNSRSLERCLFAAIYAGATLIILWAGFRMVNSSLEIRFVNNYLLHWQVGIITYQARHGQWPRFDGSNHVAYMETLTRWMQRSGVQPPDSTTNVSYRYRIDRLAAQKEEIFLLCFSDHITIYGVTRKTIRRLDKALDGQIGLDSGRLTGRLGRNKTTYIGRWRI